MAAPMLAPIMAGVKYLPAIPIAAGVTSIPGFKEGVRSAIQPGIDTFKDARGYITGYDTKQTPFEVAKERGLAGVLGGTIDSATGGMTDFDKRGDSKKQKDTKEFLKKFIFGTQGDAARKTRDEMGGGPITSFSPGERPGEFGFDFPSARVAPNINILPDT